MKLRLICGVDEAGRGPLAGPVTAAAVILDPARPISGLKDSKKLSAASRTDLAAEIRAKALAWAIASADTDEIANLNILHATMLAMKRAVEALTPAAEEAWIDGNRCPPIHIPCRAIVKGDALEPAISAASILAKTDRDAEMHRLALLYPQYGFDKHAGYPTPDHLKALKTWGSSPVHRVNFGPVKRTIEQAQGLFTQK